MSDYNFDIMLAFADIQTKEGIPFIECIEEIRGGEVYSRSQFTIIFENGMSLTGGYISRFNLNPYRCPSYHNSHTFEGEFTVTIGTREYWQDFRKAVIEVAKIYEF